MKYCAAALLVSLLLFLFGCRKDTFITSKEASVVFSSDTLRFDTVFTTVGSITQYFTIRNNNHQKLHLTNVSLKGGASSAFKINVDGVQGPAVTDIDVEADDSLYVFVSTNVNANLSDLPFIVQDSVEIGWNGNRRYVQLESWGQNANFLRARRITGNVTWTNKLPYVILGGLQVDTNAVLTIEKGCRVYLHADAPFLVDGTLKVNGDRFDSSRVYFRSDRLDDPYQAYPAGWPGIYFRGTSKDNVLNYAVIRNAYQAVVSEELSVNGNPKVTLNQCIVDNAYDAGILAVRSSVTAVNCLVSNCGKNIQLLLGGNYQFTHCTVASYTSTYLQHKDPVLYVSNNLKQDNNPLRYPLQAAFRNCIFWGDSGTVKEEVVTSNQAGIGFGVSFSNSLWRVKTQPDGATASGMLNADPQFDSLNPQKHSFDFRLKASSPAINKGAGTGVAIDLDGLPRTGVPDLGAYEKR